LQFDNEPLKNQDAIQIESNIKHFRDPQSDIRRDEVKAECEAHLMDFVRHGFEAVEGVGRPFAPGHHIEMMCEHLEAATLPRVH
jgi:hypothetical protein